MKKETEALLKTESAETMKTAKIAVKVRQIEKLTLGFDKRNYIAFAVAMVFIICGFFMLSRNDITLSPLLLVLGFCVLIPIALLLGIGTEKDENS